SPGSLQKGLVGSWPLDTESEKTKQGGFDVSTAVYDSVFSVSAQETSPHGLAFNTDGTKMFVMGTSGDDVNEYHCSAGFDVSSCSYDSNFSVYSQETVPHGLAFNTDGTKMFVTGDSGNDVNEYHCSTGFDVSTCSYDSVFYVGSQDTNPIGLAFNIEGTKMFVTGVIGNDVNEYHCSTGFDVSTCSYDSNFSISSQDTAVRGIAFSIDGTKMFVTGESGDEVDEYHCSAFDISTCSYDSVFSIAGQEASVREIVFNTDGSKMFITGTTGDDVNEYHLDPPVSIAGDKTPYSNDGTITGPTSTTGKDGESDGALSFDGTNDYITIPDASEFNSNTITISAWANFSDDSNSFIFEKGNVNTQYSLFSHGTDIVFRTKPVGGSIDTFSETKANAGIINGQWHHIVATFDGSTKKLYVDNNLIKSGAYPYTIETNNNGSAIGRFGGTSSGYFFTGDLADVRVYNRALNIEEIELLYKRRQ
ncbi:MAG: hypothetical protein KAJ58_01375, partial [Candidatus Pacebacteria bacterium]|nr:hypothetical protein [Candidatus Paceibacterota bacterium]